MNLKKMKMEEIYKTYIHNPPHLFKPDAKYFITAAVYKKYPLMHTEAVKQAVIDTMFKSFSYYHWQIEDWVLLDNHYHIMVDAPENALTLCKVINNFHRFSALWMKKHVHSTVQLKPIWYNYFDTCITYEKSYFARLNYIWYNPVRHDYVEQPK